MELLKKNKKLILICLAIVVIAGIGIYVGRNNSLGQKVQKEEATEDSEGTWNMKAGAESDERGLPEEIDGEDAKQKTEPQKEAESSKDTTLLDAGEEIVGNDTLEEAGAAGEDGGEAYVPYEKNGVPVGKEGEPQTESGKPIQEETDALLVPEDNPNRIEENFELPGKELTIEKVLNYSGYFVEDGSDDKVENVLAIRLTNRSSETLEYAQISIQSGSGKTALFTATVLQPGSTVLVLEANRMTAEPDAEYIYKDCTASFNNLISMSSDQITLDAVSGVIGVKSRDGKVYGTVYVYYKNVEDDGAYLGGITYRRKFENVGEEYLYEDTPHYDIKDSSIVRVDCYE